MGALVFYPDDTGRRTVHALQVEWQRSQRKFWSDLIEPGQHLDHRDAGLEPALVVGAALRRRQRHEPERLFREAVHRHRRHALPLDPFADAGLKMDRLVPKLRLAKS